MTNSAVNRHRQRCLDKARADFDAVPHEIRGNVFLAQRWAVKTLTNQEGSGHCFYLHREDDGIQVSFAKPSWGGDHVSQSMPTGAQAFVMAVCEYLRGV